ncbi:MAG: hypothetical protein HQK83_14585 [Fibrobacteria bacterium]|nr:hypothetical protein [Fibrobacteria bacterium]
MTDQNTPKYEIEYHFDSEKKRHYMNGFCTVLHCHHYATLFTQLADVAVHFDGERLFKESAEDTFYEVLNDYFSKKSIVTLTDKISIAEQYWKTVGMGMIHFTGVGKVVVTAEMDYSHLDEGWLKKWGSREKPVNFITAGFVAAVAALANDKPPRTFGVRETKGLVCGDDVSAFKAVIK